MELLDVLDLHLNPRRELAQLLVVRDLEHEECGGGHEIAFHRHRAALGMQVQQLQAADSGEALADLAEELGVRGVRQEPGALAALPAARLELEEALDRLRVAGAVRALERCAEQLLEPAALALELVAAAGGEPIEKRARLGSAQRRPVERHLARVDEPAALERPGDGGRHGPVRGQPLERHESPRAGFARGHQQLAESPLRIVAGQQRRAEEGVRVAPRADRAERASPAPRGDGHAGGPSSVVSRREHADVPAAEMAMCRQHELGLEEGIRLQRPPGELTPGGHVALRDRSEIDQPSAHVGNIGTWSL